MPIGTRIILFAKAPVPGRVKTRLIAALGAEKAAALAGDMLSATMEEALAAAIGPVELCADPPADDAGWRGLITPGIDLSRQGEGNLGDRLSRAASRAIASGEPVLLIGCDCPSLDRHRLRDAAALLDRHDAVIHPAEDGGYVLLGLARFDSSIFTDIEWSTASVAATTIDRIGRLGWTLAIAETLRDIDDPSDLAFHESRR